MHGTVTSRRWARLIMVAATTLLGTPTAAGADDRVSVPSDPPLSGDAGDVLRAEQVRVGLLPGARAWRVLYRSTGADGGATAVSGLILAPPRRRPGAPLVGVAPGFPGMADRCAPSRTLPRGGTELPLVAALLDRGYAVAVTDYEGMGTPGDHRYVIGTSEGHAVLDAMRAARRWAPAGVDEDAPAAITGYSQGSHAALFAAELQPGYAPDVPLAGVAAGGIAADFEAIARFMDGGWFSQVMTSVAIAYDATYPELDLEGLLTPRGRTAAAAARGDCLVDLLLSRYAFSPLSRMTTRSPLADPAWLARFRENRLPQRRPPAPLLLYHARADQGLPYAQAAVARDGYCALGAAVRWFDVPFAEHALGFLRALPRQVGWLAARLRGEPDPGTCPTG